MIDKIKKIFYNWWWRKHPPEQVRYYKKQTTERAKVILTDEGIKMQIRGEKYPFPGFPRGHILTTPYDFTNLSILKHKIKNEIFNYAWAELEKGTSKQDIIQEIKKRLFGEIYDIMEKSRYDMLPEHKLSVAVRELWRVMTELEKVGGEKIKKLKEILTFILQEDDGYRFRVQWLLNYFNPSSWWFKLFKNNLKYFEIALIHLEHAEVLGDMKGKIRLLRRILLLMLEDESIKHHFDLLCKEVNWNKLKMSKADKYFCRGKYFKCDYKVYSY